MVCDTEAGLGCVSNHGPSTRCCGHQERPANKDHQSLSPVGQGESSISNSSEEAIRNLNASAITQAAKDLCSDARRDHEYIWAQVMDWVESPFFEEVCDCAGVDVDISREKFRELYDMPLRIRRELIKKRRAEAGVRQ